jgi:8-oxo-dGTP pyrophosphatase MutT (NUDIX family)
LIAIRQSLIRPTHPVNDHALKSIAIQACGGVLFRIKNDTVEVLLIFRRNFWDIPKGKREDGESVEMCAVREVSEEVGIPIPILVARLGNTSHSYRELGVTIKKTTDWFVMVTESTEFTPQLEEEIDQVSWVNLKEAKQLVGFHNLNIVLGRFEKWFAEMNL